VYQGGVYQFNARFLTTGLSGGETRLLLWITFLCLEKEGVFISYTNRSQSGRLALLVTFKSIIKLLQARWLLVFFARSGEGSRPHLATASW
jgi:glycopeptide antibiotics resistance protein